MESLGPERKDFITFGNIINLIILHKENKTMCLAINIS